MKICKKVVLLLFCVALISGCTETKILERISTVTLLGFDQKEKDKITTTLIVRQVSPDNKSILQTRSDTEETTNGTRIKMNLETSKKIVAGQLRVVLFGKELAKAGIEQTLHTLLMNSEVSSSIYMGISDGEAKEMIEAKYENITDVGQYIFNLIDHNVKQQHSVSSTLHEVGRNNYSQFRDIAIPIIKKEGELIKISGLGIFHESKMVGELSAEDAFYVIMLRDKFKAGSVQLALPGNTLNSDRDKDDKLEVAIDSIKSKRSIKLIDSSTPEFEVKVDFGCRLVELHSDENTGRPEITKKLEKAIGDKMESEISRIIKYTQEKNSDIFGFGDDYHASIRNSGLTEKKWYEMYPNAKVNVKVNIEIFRNGIFE